MIYLEVPYTEKGIAKKLGARWDFNKKKWFVPDELDVGPFNKWMPHNEAFELALNLGPEWGGRIDQLGGACAIDDYGLHPNQKKRALVHNDWMIRAAAVALGGLSKDELERALADKNHHVRNAALSLPVTLSREQIVRALHDPEDRNRELATQRLRSSQIEIADYAGQYVDVALLEKALDFMIALEPDLDAIARTGGFAALEQAERQAEITRSEKKSEIEKVEAIARQYGAQIQPSTLTNMQGVYYSIINSAKYSRTPISSSVAGCVLRRAWDGIGEWMK